MSQINDVHESPHMISSAGYHHVAIQHGHHGPALLLPGAETSSVRRSRVRAQARQRKREIGRGAGFLQQITSVLSPTGIGSNQGEAAPSRRNMSARIEDVQTQPEYLRQLGEARRQ